MPRRDYNISKHRKLKIYLREINRYEVALLGVKKAIPCEENARGSQMKSIVLFRYLWGFFATDRI